MEAVRAGNAVDHPDDAELAARTAAYIVRAAERARSPKVLLVDAVVLVGLVVFVLAGGDARIPSGIPLALFFVAAVVLLVVARFMLGATARRAAEAERRNRGIAEMHARAAERSVRAVDR